MSLRRIGKQIYLPGFLLVLHISTRAAYLCTINLKMEVNMWLAVIISVYLAVEVLSFLSCDDTTNVIKK